MSEYDLSKLPDLLARLDEAPCARSSSRIAPTRDDIIRAWNVERAEAAAAIRALMAENSILIAAHDAQAFDFANAVAAEREACAKVCEREAVAETFRGYDECAVEAKWCAEAIRARGGA